VITGKVNISRESLSSLEVGHKPPYFLYKNLQDKSDDLEKKEMSLKIAQEMNGRITP
jgi:hypothetical protein